MTLYCQHETCRAHAAEELLWMAERLGRKDLIRPAIDALDATVRCRREPRKGPIRVPFAIPTTETERGKA